ncbi:hypothetical protein NDU88_011860, partial [Pleurodeles waltl]
WISPISFWYRQFKVVLELQRQKKKTLLPFLEMFSGFFSIFSSSSSYFWGCLIYCLLNIQSNTSAKQ